MRIVHIEDFFHPDAGYQLNILSKYMSKMGNEVFVVTSEMNKMPEHLTSFFGKEDIAQKDRDFFNETGVEILRMPIIAYRSGRSIYRSDIFRAIKRLKPDILYIHGNDTLIAMQYLLRLKKLDYPVIMDSHMLEMASVNRFNRLFRKVYKKWITPIILENKLTVIRTQNSSYVEKFLGIPLDQAPWISTGSDLMLFHQDKERKSLFRKKHNIPDNTSIAIYIGKLDESKGGKFLAEAFEKKICSESGKELALIVVGNSIGAYGQEVEELFGKSENRILRFPTQKYLDLPQFYQASDFAIFPKQCSLSFYDAQACELPVIGEDNSINLDRLSNSNGLTFREGSVDSFRSAIKTMIDMDDAKFSELCRNSYLYVKNQYNYENIAAQYMELIQEITEAVKIKGRL